MGYRFRKSINLGGGFRINLSKSGIGYSCGIPGMRYSKLANGRERYTYSIPGTGLSYVDDVSSNNQQKETREIQTLTGLIKEKVSCTDFEENSGYDEFIQKINEFRRNDKIIKIAIVLLSLVLLFVTENPIVLTTGIVGLILYIVFRNWKMLISVEYYFDEDNARFYEAENSLFSAIASARRLWLIESRYKNFDAKRNAGVDSCIERIPISVIEKIPYYLKTNIKCYCLSLRNKEFYFLPNKVLVHGKGKTVGLNFHDLSFDFDEATYVEQEGVPSDSEVVDYTYRYVNKNGGPDRRYKNNPQYPMCLYGIINIKNDEGLSLSILLSSKPKTMQAKQFYDNLSGINVYAIKKCISCGKNISIDANFCKYCGTKQ